MMFKKVHKLALLSSLICMILEFLIANACDQFCNAIIHGELTSDGQPLWMHTTAANSTHPATISCWIKYLDSSPSARYNPVLRLLMTKREIYDTFPTMPADSKDLYKIDLDYIQQGSYYNRSFEYTIYMYDERMDYTVATCGIRYHSSTANHTECWSPTFTLIKYDSIMDSSTTEDETDIATTEGTTVTDKATTTTGSNGHTTTGESRQTSDESKIPPTTRTIPATPSPPTATLASVSLLSGFGTGTSVLVLLVIILVLVIGILWTKLRTTSADMRILQATCDQLSTRANEKALEGEQPDDENPVQNTN